MSFSFIEISDPEFDRIASLMPDCCVLEIRKLNFDKTDFEKRKTDINDVFIEEMFHGTKSYNVSSILEEGLKASHNVTSAYGKGTYFSPNPKLSLFNYTNVSSNEMSYVFLCDVIKNDTGGNNRDIFVCPRDDSFLIKYLISFYKNTQV